LSIYLSPIHSREPSWKRGGERGYRKIKWSRVHYCKISNAIVSIHDILSMKDKDDINKINVLIKGKLIRTQDFPTSHE